MQVALHAGSEPDPIFAQIENHRKAFDALAEASEHFRDNAEAMSDEATDRALATLQRLAADESSLLAQFEVMPPASLAGLLAKIIYAAEVVERDPEARDILNIDIFLVSMSNVASSIMKPPKVH